ncbi:unnamed protein product [Adineta ricciae]|uniref:Ubiquitin-like domain-containing protein n=1 Tax=Adineta ricciae TaxID=249248 RepID=A0A813Y4A2_ADIRI|nr:unnamed protein product [Adineta ricciae]
MQPAPSISNTASDCYLQIRRGKQTVFMDVPETLKVLDLKRFLAHILKLNHELVRFTARGQVLDSDTKLLREYGITTKEARPQAPYQLEFVLQLEDGTFETEEIVPYTSESSSRSDEQQQMGMATDSK